jgi:hypothetical protein
MRERIVCALGEEIAPPSGGHLDSTRIPQMAVSRRLGEEIHPSRPDGDFRL